MRTVLKLVAIILAALGGVLAHAEDAPPDRLVIGYEHEGRVEASYQACVAFVKETTLWSRAEIKRGAARVCAARKRHVRAYAAFQTNYRVLMRELAKDVRLDPKGAASNLKIMMNACIEHKSSLTTGGHNIMIDVIENDIAAKCLELGGNLLREEIDEVRWPRGVAGAPAPAMRGVRARASADIIQSAQQRDQSGCICMMIYDPVCARTRDGRELAYSNACLAHCGNAEVLRKGPC